ncbi:hypothetical protein [Candidatus Liberibacter americanus]|uniref:Uncharacterized protein n=1 Tax=Candidatus Liberibacter americanus str. Sao Paulo TaxID=1261131 RepID=U6B5K0_9HYPH|nr:hypothetical protein [Candidatus Liberibacter americanus]AHA28290.1 hypothetical protein lam_959 [Candidatus Liberibacter americanus str. Sao Paulo]EMS36582.1 hypothetical protein G653_00005 [Candidatus Liberibacter americanus PW_SP]
MVFFIILSVLCCFYCVPERFQGYVLNALTKDKIAFYIINFIIWFIPFMIIPLPYNNKNIYFEFGFLLTTCYILSCYMSSRIQGHNSVARYFTEYDAKIKEPLTLIALCLVLIYVGHNMINIVLDTYITYKFLEYYTISELVIKVWMMIIGNTFLSILFLQLYKALRGKLES